MNFSDISSIIGVLFQTACIGGAAAIILYGVYWLIWGRKLFSIKENILRFLLTGYLCCIVVLTLSGGYGDAKPNLLPFSSLVYAVMSGLETAWYLIILNILMFIPMGILLPLIFKRMHFFKTLLYAFMLTAGIEIVQMLFPGRVFDIDDILFNSFGAAIGYAVYCFFALLFGKRKCGKTDIAGSAISVLLIPLSVLIVFWLKPEFEYPFNVYPERPAIILQDNLWQEEEIPTKADVFIKAETDLHVLAETITEKLGLETLTDKENLEVYQDGSLFYQKGEQTLYIAADGIFFEVKWRSSTEEMPVLSDEEMKNAAVEWLLKNGLYDEAFTEISFQDILMGDEEKIWSIGRNIVFSVPTGAADVGSIHLSFDSDGLYSISSWDEDFVFHKKIELLMPKEAVDQLALSDRLYYVTELPFPTEFHAEKLSLAYTKSIDGKYMLPVWKLEGCFYGEKGESQGYVMLPAIKN